MTAPEIAKIAFSMRRCVGDKAEIALAARIELFLLQWPVGILLSNFFFSFLSLLLFLGGPGSWLRG